MKKIQKIQQGDVLIRPCAIPKGAKRLAHRILAEGEVTGHAHVAAEKDVVLYERDGTLYMDTPKGTTVTHQEHGPVTVPAGTFQIGIVKEYDYERQEARRVAD